MKRRYKVLLLMSYIAIMISLGTVRASALTEAEVQAQVNAVGKEVVTGNLFVWFLCAVAFLKVSQKIDSFMSSLGINVGHTGGSMLSEMMIAARGVATARGMSGGGRGSGGGSGGEDFLKGGLIGAAILLNLEDEEAQRVQSTLRLSDEEIMEITHFERGSGLISTNNNNITVEFRCSDLEKSLITTDSRELQELIARKQAENMASKA